MRSQMKWVGRSFALGSVLALLLALQPATLVRAEDEDYGSTFARVRHFEGTLHLQRTQEGEVTEASLNSPVAPGDRLWTEQGRAEVALADGSVIWLDQDTRLDVRNLSDIENRYEKTNLLALEQGGLRIEAPEAESKDKVFQVDTEAGSLYLLSGGSFRVDADNGVTTVSSYRGVAELSGDDGSTMVRSGERGSVRRGRAPADARPFNTLRQDDFDRFCEARQAAFVRAGERQPVDEVQQQIPEQVHPYVTELSSYGSWRYLPPYGWVWRPVYSPGWGPYVNGYWDWYPTGWIWVSYDPWGWAPYHYGRWDFAVNLGWIWIPGGLWSGAWVSFAVGPSYIGWCPLNFYNRPVFQTININVTNVNVTRLDPRGWRFAPVGRFATRGGPVPVVRPDRLPRGTDMIVTGRLPRFDPRQIAARPERGRQLIETVRASRVPLPAETAPAGREVPFRNLERPAERGRPSAAPPRATPRPQARTPQRAPRPQATPAPRGTPQARPRPPRGNERARERAQRAAPGRPTAHMPWAAMPPGHPRAAEPRPQPPAISEASPRGPRRDHVVERIFEGVRRDQPHVSTPRPEPRIQPRPSAEPRPRGGSTPPPRPPRREKDR